jgi:hypothetical protein
MNFTVTGLQPSLHKFQPREKHNIARWNFVGRAGYHSGDLINPKQKIDFSSKEALHDVTREVSLATVSVLYGF